MSIFMFVLSFATLGFLTPVPAGNQLRQVTTMYKPAIKWSVKKSSTLSVEGKSNVNKFRCDIEGYDQPDTIFCQNQENKDKTVSLKGSLHLDIFKFDCHSRMITKDLRNTLQAEEHPSLVIRFLSLERIPVFNGDADLVKGWVTIELAGASRTVEINYSFMQRGTSEILLNGGRMFCFSDFNLKPPRRLAGIIQIRDEFAVNFRLTLDPV